MSVFVSDETALERRFSSSMAEQNQSEPALEQAKFDINNINSADARNTVRDAVKDLNGVRDVQFVGCCEVVTYNPIGITKEKMCSAIRRSGYRATAIESRCMGLTRSLSFDVIECRANR